MPPTTKTLTATIATHPMTRQTATTILTYLQSIHASLTLAQEFLRGFEQTSWAPPGRVIPTTTLPPSTSTSSSRSPSPHSYPTQIDQDIIIARHLALSATMRRLINLDVYPNPRGGKEELWIEFAELQTEAQGISDYFAHNHGIDVDRGGGGGKDDEMRQLEAVWEWYSVVFQPCLMGLMKEVKSALGDEGRWMLEEEKKVDEGAREKPVAVKKEYRVYQCVGLREKELPLLPDDDDEDDDEDDDYGESVRNYRVQAASVRASLLEAGPALVEDLERVSCRTVVKPLFRSLLARRTKKGVPEEDRRPLMERERESSRDRHHRHRGASVRHRKSAEDEARDRSE